MQAGQSAALEPFLRLVMMELRRRARFLLARESPAHSLQNTKPVEEAFLRLFDGQPVPWLDPGEFLLASSRELRRMLVDHARRANKAKHVGLPAGDHLSGRTALDTNLAAVLEVEPALRALAAVSPRAGRIVELRFFGGLSNEETAAVVGISTKTVAREWTWARAWLFRHMSREQTGTTSGDAASHA